MVGLSIRVICLLDVRVALLFDARKVERLADDVDSDSFALGGKKLFCDRAGRFVPDGPLVDHAHRNHPRTGP